MFDEAAYQMFLDAGEQGFDYCPKCVKFEECNKQIADGGKIPELVVCFEYVKQGYEKSTRKAD